MKSRTISRLALAFGILFTGTALAKCPNLYEEFEAFYVRATDSLLSEALYAVKVADPRIVGDNRQLYQVDPVTDWGGRIALSYYFCPENGASLDYTFFNQSRANTVQNNNRNADNAPVLAPAEFIDITDESTAKFSLADAKLTIRYDTLDLYANRKIPLVCNSCINIFAGIRYFHLGEKLHNSYHFNDRIFAVNVLNHYEVNFENSLNTIGPLVGAKVNYNLGCHFGVTGLLAASWLYGDASSEFHNSYTLSPASTPLGDGNSLTSSEEHHETSHAFPALSGKVGLNFCYSFPCLNLRLEAGYRGDKYFNAVNDVAYQHLLAGDDINSKCNYQDFSVVGPYFNITLSV